MSIQKILITILIFIFSIVIIPRIVDVDELLLVVKLNLKIYDIEESKKQFLVKYLNFFTTKRIDRKTNNFIQPIMKEYTLNEIPEKNKLNIYTESKFGSIFNFNSSYNAFYNPKLNAIFIERGLINVSIDLTNHGDENGDIWLSSINSKPEFLIFILLHELGHYKLHRHLYENEFSFCDSDHRKKIEIQADEFARKNLDILGFVSLDEFNIYDEDEYFYFVEEVWNSIEYIEDDFYPNKELRMKKIQNKIYEYIDSLKKIKN